jgi:hypothetical protein
LRPTSRIGARRDIVESGDTSRVKERVQESERCLVLGDASIVKERNYRSECLSKGGVRREIKQCRQNAYGGTTARSSD